MKYLFSLITITLFFLAQPALALGINCSPDSGNAQSCALAQGQQSGGANSMSGGSEMNRQNYSAPSAGNNQTQVVNVNVGASGQPQQAGGMPGGDGRQGRGGGGIGGILARLAEGFIVKNILGIPISGMFNI